jgi:hypothetical protein
MTRKVGPPGWREHMMMDRLDGFVGGPSHIRVRSWRVSSQVRPRWAAGPKSKSFTRE